MMRSKGAPSVKWDGRDRCDQEQSCAARHSPRHSLSLPCAPNQSRPDHREGGPHSLLDCDIAAEHAVGTGQRARGRGLESVWEGLRQGGCPGWWGRGIRDSRPLRGGGLFLTCRASAPSALLFWLTRATQGFAGLGLASLRLRVTVTGTFLHSLGGNRLSYRKSFHFATEQVFFFSFKACGQPVCLGNFASRQPRLLLKHGGEIIMVCVQVCMIRK